MKKEDEIVLVVEREKLFNGENLSFQGHTSDDDLIRNIIDNINSNYISMRRGSVEEKDSSKENAELNFDYKQPIPYVVIRKGDKLFATKRLEGGGESRLHGKISLGIGGHMNPIPASNFLEVLEENTMRELNEEVDIDGDINVKTIGLINDDSEDVSKVHLGILGVIELSEGDSVKVKEVEQLEGSWMSISELKKASIYDRLENWGKIVVDMIE